MSRMCSGVRKVWAVCVALLLSLVACCGGENSAAEFAKEFREREAAGMLLKFDSVRPFRDRFCYHLKVEEDDISVERAGTCLRGAIIPRGKTEATGFVYADESGIYVSKNETANYTLVMSSLRNGDYEGGPGLAELFVRVQLRALKRIFVCDDEVPSKIILPNGRVARPRGRTFDGCDRSCLSLQVLQTVRHVRMGKAHESRVLCFGKLCTTPMHRVFFRGQWLTMATFCGENGGCRERVQQVAKALFGTQEMKVGDDLLYYGVVYGRGTAELSVTRLLQAVVDAMVSVQSYVGDLMRRSDNAGKPYVTILQEKPQHVCELGTQRGRGAFVGMRAACVYRWPNACRLFPKGLPGAPHYVKCE